MTKQERLYLKSLRESYGLSQKDVADLLRVYGFDLDFETWTAETVAQAGEMLQVNGESYARTMAIAQKAREELQAMQARREKRAA